MGKELLLSGAAVEMLAIGTPGMILGRRLGGLNDPVDIFGIDRFGLVGQFFVSGKGELAQMIWISNSCMARPNWVTPFPSPRDC